MCTLSEQPSLDKGNFDFLVDLIRNRTPEESLQALIRSGIMIPGKGLAEKYSQPHKERVKHMFVVLCWYYNERDGRIPHPELSGVYGPFPTREDAHAWTKKQSKWGGYGKLVYETQEVSPPTPDEEQYG